MKIALIASVASLAFILACSKTGGGGGGTTQNPLDCSTITNKAFGADINPIIQGSCTTIGCHNAGSNNGPGGLTTYNQIFNARGSIRSAVASGLMPQGSTLTTAQKNSILCWIDGGAPND